MKSKLALSLPFIVAIFFHQGDSCIARICPPKGNAEGVIVGVGNFPGGTGGSNVDRDADTKKFDNKPMTAQPPASGVEKKPTKTDEQVALLKDLKDKTGGSIDLLKSKDDKKKMAVDKGKTGTTTEEQPPQSPEPPETPPLPDDEDGKGGGSGGRGLNSKEIEQIKKQYGVEEVIGGPGDFWIHKDGKWMRPEEVKGSTVTPKSQEDDPTKDPLYAGAGNLWDAKNIEESGKPPDYYGETSEKYGDDLKEKTRATQDRVIALNEDRRKETSTNHTHKKTTQKTTKDTKDKSPTEKTFKCKSNQDCWDHYSSAQYYCNKGTGKCIECPEGSHGNKDGSAECCKDEPSPATPPKTEDVTKFPKIYSGTIKITLPGCSSNQPITVNLEDHTVGPKNLETYKYNLVANYGFSIKYDKEKGVGSVEAGKITPHYGYHYSNGTVSILTLGLKGNYTDKKLDGEGGYKRSGVYGDYSVKYQVSLSRQK